MKILRIRHLAMIIDSNNLNSALLSTSFACSMFCLQLQYSYAKLSS